MTPIQKIIETGVIDDNVDIQTLEAARMHIEFFIARLKENTWGPVGKYSQKQFEERLVGIQARINWMHGADGMTPLNPPKRVQLAKPLIRLIEQLEIENDPAAIFTLVPNDDYSPVQAPQYHQLKACGNDLELGACFERKEIRVYNVATRQSGSLTETCLMLEVRPDWSLKKYPEPTV